MPAPRDPSEAYIVEYLRKKKEEEEAEERRRLGIDADLEAESDADLDIDADLDTDADNDSDTDLDTDTDTDTDTDADADSDMRVTFKPGYERERDYIYGDRPIVPNTRPSPEQTSAQLDELRDLLAEQYYSRGDGRISQEDADILAADEVYRHRILGADGLGSEMLTAAKMDHPLHDTPDAIMTRALGRSPRDITSDETPSEERRRKAELITGTGITGTVSAAAKAALPSQYGGSSRTGPDTDLSDLPYAERLLAIDEERERLAEQKARTSVEDQEAIEAIEHRLAELHYEEQRLHSPNRSAIVDLARSAYADNEPTIREALANRGDDALQELADLFAPVSLSSVGVVGDASADHPLLSAIPIPRALAESYDLIEQGTAIGHLPILGAEVARELVEDRKRRSPGLADAIEDWSGVIPTREEIAEAKSLRSAGSRSLIFDAYAPQIEAAERWSDIDATVGQLSYNALPPQVRHEIPANAEGMFGGYTVAEVRAAPLRDLPASIRNKLVDIDSLKSGVAYRQRADRLTGGAAADALGTVMLQMTTNPERERLVLKNLESLPGWMMNVPASLSTEAIMEANVGPADIPVFGSALERFAAEATRQAADPDASLVAEGAAGWATMLRDLKLPTTAGLDYMMSSEAPAFQMAREAMGVEHYTPIRNFDTSYWSRVIANLDVGAPGATEGLTEIAWSAGFRPDDPTYKVVQTVGLGLDFLLDWEKMAFGGPAAVFKGGARGAKGAHLAGTGHRVEGFVAGAGPSLYAKAHGLQDVDVPSVFSHLTTKAAERDIARGINPLDAHDAKANRRFDEAAMQAGLDPAQLRAVFAEQVAEAGKSHLDNVRATLQRNTPEDQTLRASPGYRAFKDALDTAAADSGSAITPESAVLFRGLHEVLAHRFNPDNPAAYFDQLEMEYLPTEGPKTPTADQLAAGGRRAPGTAPHFYSPIEEAIPWAFGSATAMKPRALLAKIKRGQGVRDAELRWLGLEDWLLQQQGRVTPQQVREYIDANRIEVDEILLGEHPLAGDRGFESRTRLAFTEDIINGDSPYLDLRAAWNQHPEVRIEEMEDLQDNLRLWADGEAEAIEAIDPIWQTLTGQTFSQTWGEHRQRQVAQDAPDHQTKYNSNTYRSRTDAADTNYRELLLRVRDSGKNLPEGWRVGPADEAGAQGIWTVTDPEGRTIGAGRSEADALAYARKHDERLAGRTFNGEHFDQDNVFAHVRFTERMDGDRLILSVEEVQGDWPQAGRDAGYADDPAVAKARAAGESVAPVPPLPFRDNWHEIATKRMIRYAAENGYDAVEFPSARMAVGKFNTESIGWSRQADGSFKVYTQKRTKGRNAYIKGPEGPEGKTARDLAEREGVTVKTRADLDNLLEARRIGQSPGIIRRLQGRTIADTVWKQMQAEDAGIYQPRRAGMENFYDKRLPGFLTKYLKTNWKTRARRGWRPGHPGSEEVTLRGNPPSVRQVKAWADNNPRTPGAAQLARDYANTTATRQDDPFLRALDRVSREHPALIDEVEQAFNVEVGAETTQINLTPEMSDSVLYRGQSLFQLDDNGIAAGVFSQDVQDGNLSSLKSELTPATRAKLNDLQRRLTDHEPTVRAKANKDLEALKKTHPHLALAVHKPSFDYVKIRATLIKLARDTAPKGTKAAETTNIAASGAEILAAIKAEHPALVWPEMEAVLRTKRRALRKKVTIKDVIAFVEKAHKAEWKAMQISTADWTGLPASLTMQATRRRQNWQRSPEKWRISNNNERGRADDAIIKLREIADYFSTRRNRNPLDSEENWGWMNAEIGGSWPKRNRTVVPPYKALEYRKDPGKIVKLLERLTPEQKAASELGMETSRKWRGWYAENRDKNGKMLPVDQQKIKPQQTAELLAWVFLSRGVSAYPHESGWTDMLRNGLTEYINIALTGKYDADARKKYEAWCDQMLRDGTPSKGVTSNIRMFGFGDLVKKGKNKGKQRNKAILQNYGKPLLSGKYKGKIPLLLLHEWLSNPKLTGKEIRRRWHVMFDGRPSGLDNKLISFFLLLAGRNDILVFDRVQSMHFWDAKARRLQYGLSSIYEGFKAKVGLKNNPRPWGKARGIGTVFNGRRGLAVYETIEDGLRDSVRAAYTTMAERDLNVPEGTLARVREAIENLDHTATVQQAHDAIQAAVPNVQLRLFDEALAGDTVSKADLLDLLDQQTGSMGLFHWQSWVVYGQQETGHATLHALERRMQGATPDEALAGITVRQGDWRRWDYNIQYTGLPGIDYKMVLDGEVFWLTTDGREKYLKAIKRHSENKSVRKGFKRVIPTGFKPNNRKNRLAGWIDQDEVNRDNLKALVRRYALKPAEAQQRALALASRKPSGPAGLDVGGRAGGPDAGTGRGGAGGGAGGVVAADKIDDGKLSALSTDDLRRRLYDKAFSGDIDEIASARELIAALNHPDIQSLNDLLGPDFLRTALERVYRSYEDPELPYRTRQAQRQQVAALTDAEVKAQLGEIARGERFTQDYTQTSNPHYYARAIGAIAHGYPFFPDEIGDTIRAIQRQYPDGTVTWDGHSEHVEVEDGQHVEAVTKSLTDALPGTDITRTDDPRNGKYGVWVSPIYENWSGKYSQLPKFKNEIEAIADLNGGRLSSPEAPLTESEKRQNLDRFLGRSTVRDRVYHYTPEPGEFEEFDTGLTGSHFGTYRAAIDRSEVHGDRTINYELDVDDDGEVWVTPDQGPNGGQEAGPFKTKGEARAYIKTQPKRIEPLEFYIRLENPLDVPDLGTWHPSIVMQFLGEKGILTEAEIASVYDGLARSDAEGSRRLMEAVKSKGYDGFRYQNDVEDKGSTSYVVFDPKQVKSATDNIGTYSRDDGSFLKSTDYPEPEFQAWFKQQLYLPQEIELARAEYAKRSQLARILPAGHLTLIDQGRIPADRMNHYAEVAKATEADPPLIDWLADNQIDGKDSVEFDLEYLQTIRDSQAARTPEGWSVEKQENGTWAVRLDDGSYAGLTLHDRVQRLTIEGMFADSAISPDLALVLHGAERATFATRAEAAEYLRRAAMDLDAAAGGRHPQDKSPFSTGLVERGMDLGTVEAVTAQGQREHLTGFGADGRQVFRQGGKTDQVNLNRDDILHLRQIPGLRFTHNHPSHQGLMLSPEDIVFAAGTNAVEMRAVTPNGIIYTLKASEEAWEAAGIGREVDGKPRRHYAGFVRSMQGVKQIVADRLNDKARAARRAGSPLTFTQLVEQQNELYIEAYRETFRLHRIDLKIEIENRPEYARGYGGRGYPNRGFTRHLGRRGRNEAGSGMGATHPQGSGRSRAAAPGAHPGDAGGPGKTQSQVGSRRQGPRRLVDPGVEQVSGGLTAAHLNKLLNSKDPDLRTQGTELIAALTTEHPAVQELVTTTLDQLEDAADALLNVPRQARTDAAYHALNDQIEAALPLAFYDPARAQILKEKVEGLNDSPGWISGQRFLTLPLSIDEVADWLDNVLGVHSENGTIKKTTAARRLTLRTEGNVLIFGGDIAGYAAEVFTSDTSKISKQSILNKFAAIKLGGGERNGGLSPNLLGRFPELADTNALLAVNHPFPAGWLERAVEILQTRGSVQKPKGKGRVAAPDAAAALAQLIENSTIESSAQVIELARALGRQDPTIQSAAALIADNFRAKIDAAESAARDKTPDWWEAVTDLEEYAAHYADALAYLDPDTTQKLREDIQRRRQGYKTERHHLDIIRDYLNIPLTVDEAAATIRDLVEASQRRRGDPDYRMGSDGQLYAIADADASMDHLAGDTRNGWSPGLHASPVDTLDDGRQVYAVHLSGGLNGYPVPFKQTKLPEALARAGVSLDPLHIDGDLTVRSPDLASRVADLLGHRDPDRVAQGLELAKALPGLRDKADAMLYLTPWREYIRAVVAGQFVFSPIRRLTRNIDEGQYLPSANTLTTLIDVLQKGIDEADAAIASRGPENTSPDIKRGRDTIATERSHAQQLLADYQQTPRPSTDDLTSWMTNWLESQDLTAEISNDPNTVEEEGGVTAWIKIPADQIAHREAIARDFLHSLADAHPGAAYNVTADGHYLIAEAFPRYLDEMDDVIEMLRQPDNPQSQVDIYGRTVAPPPDLAFPAGSGENGGWRIISLFDGISCGQQAMKNLGIPIAEYHAAEIDRHAKTVTRANHPNTIEHGNVETLNPADLPDEPDLFIGGSPCQDLRKGREGLKGSQSRLFYSYVDLLKKKKPRHFLFENTAEIRPEDQEIVTKLLGVEPIAIDSALVSGQRRRRYYWTNIPGVSVPADRGLLFRDVMMSYEEASALPPEQVGQMNDTIERTMMGVPKGSTKSRAEGAKGNAMIPDAADKSPTLVRRLGKGSPYDIVVDRDDAGNFRFRRLARLEAERLQGLPDGYTDSVSRRQAFFGIGNGFNVQTIEHILSHLGERADSWGDIEGYQERLFSPQLTAQQIAHVQRLRELLDSEDPAVTAQGHELLAQVPQEISNRLFDDYADDLAEGLTAGKRAIEERVGGPVEVQVSDSGEIILSGKAIEDYHAAGGEPGAFIEDFPEDIHRAGAVNVEGDQIVIEPNPDTLPDPARLRNRLNPTDDIDDGTVRSSGLEARLAGMLTHQRADLRAQAAELVEALGRDNPQVLAARQLIADRLNKNLDDLLTEAVSADRLADPDGEPLDGMIYQDILPLAVQVPTAIPAARARVAAALEAHPEVEDLRTLRDLLSLPVTADEAADLIAEISEGFNAEGRGEVYQVSADGRVFVTTTADQLHDVLPLNRYTDPDSTYYHHVQPIGAEQRVGDLLMQEVSLTTTHNPNGGQWNHNPPAYSPAELVAAVRARGLPILGEKTPDDINDGSVRSSTRQYKMPKLPTKRTIRNRVIELQDAARDLIRGLITAQEYTDLVNLHKPVRTYKTVPQPEPWEKMHAALSEDKRAKLPPKGQRPDRPAGAITGLRLDIPAYYDSDTWIVTVHDAKPGADHNAGTPVAYDSVAWLDGGVTFGMPESAALKIAAGANKGTIATMKGGWRPTTPAEAKARADAALTDPAWIQVGMDPERHSYFYDRATMEPVVSADEVIQIGPLVLAKNARKEPADNFLYQRDDAGQAQGSFGTRRPTNLHDATIEDAAAAKQDVSGNPAFKQWFGQSKVVDADGQPIMVYHGTPNHGFTRFDPEKIGTTSDEGYLGRGFYFTDDNHGVAGWYADDYGDNPGVYGLYLRLENPLVIDGREHLMENGQMPESDEVIAAVLDLPDIDRADADTLTARSKEVTDLLKERGHDGVIFHFPDKEGGIGGTEYMVLDSHQIKSATDNAGTYSRDTDDTLASRDRSSTIKGTYQQQAMTGLIRLYKNGQLRTLFHETGHALVEMLLGPEGYAKLTEEFDNTPEAIVDRVADLTAAGHTPDEIARTIREENQDLSTFSPLDAQLAQWHRRANRSGPALSERGHEQAARAWEHYIDFRLGPTARSTRLFGYLLQPLREWWFTVRSEANGLPASTRAQWDAILRPNQYASDRVLTASPAAIRESFPTITVPADPVTRVEEGTVRKAIEQEAEDRSPSSRADILQQIGMKDTGQPQDVNVMDVTVKLLAAVQAERARTLPFQGELVRMTLRTIVPASRVERIRDEVRSVMSDTLGNDFDDINAEGNDLVLTEAQATALAQLAAEVGSEPMGQGVVPDRLLFLDPTDPAQRRIPLTDYNDLVEGLIDTRAGVAARRSKSAEAMPPSLGYALLRTLGQAPGKMARRLGFHELAEAGKKFEELFIVKSKLGEVADPGARDLIDRHFRGLEAVHLQIIRTIHDIRNGADTKTIRDTIQLLRHHTTEPVQHTQVKDLSYFRGIVGDGTHGNLPPHLDKLLTAPMINRLTGLLQGGIGLSSQERAALTQLRKYAGDPALRKGKGATDEIAAATAIIQDGLRRRQGLVDERGRMIAMALAGDDPKRISSLTHADYRDLYQRFYAGQWAAGDNPNGPSLAQWAADKGLDTGYENKTAARIDPNTALLSMIARMMAMDRLQNLYADLTKYGLAVKIPDGENPSLWMENVQHYLSAALTGNDISLVDENGKVLRNAVPPPDQPHDVAAYNEARRILHTWGIDLTASGQKDWKPILFPGGQEVLVPPAMQEELQAALDRVARVGGDVSLSPRTESNFGPSATWTDKAAREVGDTLTAIWQMFPRLDSAIRMGVTTGMLIPNAAYFTANFLSAAFQVYQTRGLKGTHDAFIGVSPRLTAGVVKRLWNRGRPMGPVRDAAAGAMGRMLAALPVSPVTMITRDGRIYTADLIADLAKREGLDSSFIQAETAQTIARDIRDLHRPFWKKIVQGPTDALSAWQDFMIEAATATDNYWRVGTFIDELYEGRSPAEAAQTAREALYDYSHLTDFEKKYLRQVIMFYSFVRRNVAHTMDTLLRHPHRVLGQLRLMRGVWRLNVQEEEEVFEKPGAYIDPAVKVPGFYQSRLPVFFRNAVKDTHAKSSVAFLSPPLPAVDTLNLYLDLYAVAAQPGETRQNAVRGLVARTTPWVQAPFVAATGQDIFYGRELQDFDDVPPWLVAMDYSLTGGALVHDVLDVVPVTTDNPGRWFNDSSAVRFTPRNGIAWWAWRNLGSALPGAGRNMDTIDAMDRAGLINTSEMARRTLQARDYYEEITGEHRPRMILEDDIRNLYLTQDVLQPRYGLTQNEEALRLMGIRAVLIPNKKSALDQAETRQAMELSDRIMGFEPQ